MSLPTSPCNDGQRGQALTEFLVLALVLVPLFLLVPVLAKYQDIAHATQMASRYIAFDAFVRNDPAGTWKPEAELAEEVRRRFFGNSDTPVKTHDAAGNFKAHQTLFWRNPDDTSMIADVNRDVSVGFGPANGAAHESAFTAVEDEDASFSLASKFGLRSRGIYTANVAVAVANVPAALSAYRPFDSLNLRMQRSTSILFDSWSARGPVEAEQRFGGNPTIFPAGELAALNSVVGAAVTAIDVGLVSPPRLGQLDFWRDIVPDDRLD
jgi:hypothetical protein